MACGASAVDAVVPQGGCSQWPLTADGMPPVAVSALDEGAATAVLMLPRDATDAGGEWSGSSAVPARTAVACTLGEPRVASSCWTG